MRHKISDGPSKPDAEDYLEIKYLAIGGIGT
jgi:hypothetical protein